MQMKWHQSSQDPFLLHFYFMEKYFFVLTVVPQYQICALKLSARTKKRKNQNFLALQKPLQIMQFIMKNSHVIP